MSRGKKPPPRRLGEREGESDLTFSTLLSKCARPQVLCPVGTSTPMLDRRNP